MNASLLLLMGLLPLSANAQHDKYDASKELRGNGRVVREIQTVKPFDILEISQFPAKITVDVGGTESSVTIAVDDNLRPLLQVESEDGTLTLSFKDPQNRPFWISKASLDVRITTPVLTRLKHGSNGDVTVSGLRGDSFVLANQANGNVTLRGKVNRLDVASSANGTINADELIVQTANVVAQANATVRVNARQVSVTKQAFANVINVADRTETSAMNQTALTTPVRNAVRIRFKNNSPLPRSFSLVSYAPGENGNETNGFTLAPYANRQKKYPVGTAVFVATNDQLTTVMSGRRLEGKPFLTVAVSDEGRTVNLVK